MRRGTKKEDFSLRKTSLSGSRICHRNQWMSNFPYALLRLLDATGITHGFKRTPQWNHAAFADDLSIYVSTVSDGNKLLEVIHEFESWSGLRISIPKSVVTGAMYGTSTIRRQADAKADAVKRKRDAGPDILNPQIRALEAMDEALDTDNTIEHNTKGHEVWRMNLAMMLRQCPISNQKKGISFFPTQLHLNPPCLECKHACAWKPSGIKYNATALKVTHGKAPIRLLGIRYNMWLDSAAQRRYVMDGITEMACFLRKNRDLSIENGLRLIDCTLGPLLAFSGPVIIWLEKEFKKLTAAFVRCNKEAWQMSPNTSTALFTFLKDLGGLQTNCPEPYSVRRCGAI